MDLSTGLVMHCGERGCSWLMSMAKCEEMWESIPKYSKIFRIPVQEVQATESLRNLCDLCDFASSAMAWTCATWTQSAECAVEHCRTL